MLFYNEDWIHFVATRYNAGIEVTEENLREYIYSLKGTQITDFAMNINGSVSGAPSDIMQTFVQRYLLKEDNGECVDYTNTFAKEFYNLIVKKSIDMYAVWVKALNEVGINPWISIRLNDCHGSMEKTDLRKSSYIEAHPEYHISSYREKDGYFDKCLDYAKKEVRELMIAYIDEALSKYDVCGLELDMMREMFFFKCGFEKQGQEIMAGFIGDVRKILNKYEKEYGHKIKLSLILPPSPETVYNKGVDISSISKYIDYITIIGRWETTDTDMPIEIWKQILKNTDIKLGGGQQLLVKSYPKYEKIPTITSVDMAFGQAIANTSRGCDFVYLYNYMDFGKYEGMEEWMYEDCIRNDKNRSLLFNNIGEKHTLLKQNRSHVVTFCDFEMTNREVHGVLPLCFDKDSVYTKIKIPIGEVPENAKAMIVLGIDDYEETIPDDFSVYVNGEECTFFKEMRLERLIYDKKCYAFSIEKNLFDIIYAEIKVSKKCSVEYIEVKIISNKEC